MEMMRNFIFYLADAGQGRDSGRITRRAAITFVGNFPGAIKHCNSRLDPEVAE
jgi:hypothetical protein